MCPTDHRNAQTFDFDLAPISPRQMLCMLLAALAVLLAESFRGRGERMPLGGLGLVGLVGAGISAVLLWDRNAEGFGVILADNFGLFATLILVVSAS